MNIRIFEYFLSLNEYSLFEYVFVHIHLFNILYKFMVGTSKCPKLKQNPLKIGCNKNQNSLRWGLTWVGCYPGQLPMNLAFMWLFFGVLHIFKYIWIFKYDTEQMSHIWIFKKPIFSSHSSNNQSNKTKFHNWAHRSMWNVFLFPHIRNFHYSTFNSEM